MGHRLAFHAQAGWQLTKCLTLIIISMNEWLRSRFKSSQVSTLMMKTSWTKPTKCKCILRSVNVLITSRMITLALILWKEIIKSPSRATLLKNLNLLKIRWTWKTQIPCPRSSNPFTMMERCQLRAWIRSNVQEILCPSNSIFKLSSPGNNFSKFSQTRFIQKLRESPPERMTSHIKVIPINPDLRTLQSLDVPSMTIQIHFSMSCQNKRLIFRALIRLNTPLRPILSPSLKIRTISFQFLCPSVTSQNLLRSESSRRRLRKRRRTKLKWLNNQLVIFLSKITKKWQKKKWSRKFHKLWSPKKMVTKKMIAPQATMSPAKRRINLVTFSVISIEKRKELLGNLSWTKDLRAFSGASERLSDWHLMRVDSRLASTTGVKPDGWIKEESFWKNS